MKCWFLVVSIPQQTAASLCWSYRQEQAAAVYSHHKGFGGSNYFQFRKWKLKQLFINQEKNIHTCQQIKHDNCLCCMWTEIYKKSKPELSKEQVYSTSVTQHLWMFWWNNFMLCSTAASVNVYSKEYRWIYCGTNRQPFSAWRHVNRYNITACLKCNNALNSCWELFVMVNVPLVI